VIKIDKLKIEGSEIVVEYSSLLESFRIVTTDEPKVELYQAAANVAILGREYLVLPIGGFLSIAFSHGDEPGSRLVLIAPTTEQNAKIACPKISLDEVRDAHLVRIENHPRNIYNAAVTELIRQTVDFVNGKRLQMSLPLEFSSPEEPADEEEAEEEIADPRVLEFSTRA
jgi:hypothetical protein